MKQTTDLSTVVAGMVSEVVSGIITGVTSARRAYYRNLLLVAIIVASAAFAIATVFRDYLPSIPITAAENNISTPTPTPAPLRYRRPTPTPQERDEAEELRQLARPNPM